MPTVSIITPTYNRAGFVGSAIEHILAQSFQDWELIVVDDGSTDATPEVVEAYRRRDPRIRSVRQANAGLPAARNAGLRVARGEYVAFLDDDDRFLPEKLERQLPLLRQRPELGFVYGPVWMQYEGETCVRKQVPEQLEDKYANLFERNLAQVCSVLARRSAIEAVGGFNERQPRCADYDLWLRLAARFPFDYTTEPVGVYHRHPRNMSANAVAMLAEHLAILRGVIGWKRLGVSASLRRRTLATTSYQLARHQLEAGRFLGAAESFLRAACWRPDIGVLAKPQQGIATQGLLRRAVKPYAGIAYCLMRGVAHAGR